MRVYDDQFIVITGGAGLIGSCFIRHLNDIGLHNLIVVDNLGCTDKWKNLVGKRFIDFIPKQQLFDWLPGKESAIEAIIHLGACSDTMQVDANYLLDNNYRYSVKLAEYALNNDLRFIYASSAATYGDGSRGFKDDQNTLYDLQPLNMYGFSKQLFDQWAYDQNVLDQIVGLKFFNVFGPNENHKGQMASAITRMVPRLMEGEKIRLFKSNDPQKFSDGEQKRDFIYVKDVVKMIYAFLKSDVAGIYNVGSGEATSWNHLAQTVAKALQRPLEIEYIEMPTELLKKYQNFSQADMAKTRSVLNKEADCMSFEAAVTDYVNNYLVPDLRW